MKKYNADKRIREKATAYEIYGKILWRTKELRNCNIIPKYFPLKFPKLKVSEKYGEIL